MRQGRHEDGEKQRGEANGGREECGANRLNEQLRERFSEIRYPESMREWLCEEDWGFGQW